MRKLGFADKFEKLVTECICDPTYPILVNGSLTEWFQANLGLRQGDPLSPYLFIIGTEVLTRLIKREQSRGRLTRLPYDNSEQHLADLFC